MSVFGRHYGMEAMCSQGEQTEHSEEEEEEDLDVPASVHRYRELLDAALKRNGSAPGKFAKCEWEVRSEIFSL